MGYVRQQFFFEDSIKDFAIDMREAYGFELSWVGCVGLGSPLRGEMWELRDVRSIGRVGCAVYRPRRFD